jgi:hypothetical protein
MSFHRLLHHHYLSFGVSEIYQIVADIPTGLCLVPTQEIEEKKRSLSVLEDLRIFAMENKKLK